ncbi:MAG: hypothetical protein ACTSU8_01085 [Alphaproteobacteria bacterium]
MLSVPAFQYYVKSLRAQQSHGRVPAGPDRFIWFDKFCEPVVFPGGQGQQNIIGKPTYDFSLGLDLTGSADRGNRIRLNCLRPTSVAERQHYYHDKQKNYKSSIVHQFNPFYGAR